MAASRSVIRALAFAASLAVLVSGCGGDDDRRSAGGGRTVAVRVDAHTNRFNGSFLTYFPQRVTVRAGDAIEFRVDWTGEPHGVAFGTLAERALAAADGPGPESPEPAQVPLGELVWPGSLPPAAAQPCYLDAGAPPSDGTTACPTAAKPAFSGRQAYHSSGFIPESSRYTLDIAKDAAPGEYHYFCPFHGPSMRGTVVVRAGGREPSQAAIDEAARRQLAALVDAVLPNHDGVYKPFKRARAGRFPFPALAGFAGGPAQVAVNEFVPFTIKAKQDEPVTWSVLGRHVISLRPPSNSGPPAVIRLENGRVQFVRESLQNVKSVDPPRAAPSERVLLDGGRYDRDRGIHASGLLVAEQPGTLLYQIRFTRPGSYRYRCLVHPGMGGLVTVTR